MRKTLLGMAGVATLALSVNAWAEGLRDERQPVASTVVHRERADERITYGAEEMKPCDANATEGSASGEPSAKGEPAAKKAERAASQEEFLRNVWTTP